MDKKKLFVSDHVSGSSLFSVSGYNVLESARKYAELYQKKILDYLILYYEDFEPILDIRWCDDVHPLSRPLSISCECHTVYEYNLMGAVQAIRQEIFERDFKWWAVTLFDDDKTRVHSLIEAGKFFLTHSAGYCIGVDSIGNIVRLDCYPDSQDFFSMPKQDDTK